MFKPLYGVVGFVPRRKPWWRLEHCWTGDRGLTWQASLPGALPCFPVHVKPQFFQSLNVAGLIEREI